MTRNILTPLLLSLAISGVALPAVAHQANHQAHRAMEKEQKEWGIGGDASAVTRTIEIKMLDTMRFVPDQITVKQGETVRLTVINTGKVMHELVIGTKKELDMHAEMMKNTPTWNMMNPTWHMSHQGKRQTSSGTSIEPGSLILLACCPGITMPVWLEKSMSLREHNNEASTVTHQAEFVCGSLGLQ